MKRLGVIGYGNMGSAIAERIKEEYSVVVFDKDSNKTKNLSGMEAAADIIALVKTTEAIILAVKPQDFEAVLKEIKDVVKDKLVISIAAGIPTGYVEKHLGGARVVRTMPNLAVSIGQGCTNICGGKFIKAEDLVFVEEIFNCAGKTIVLKEEMMDAATAVSGSGPGFFFSLVQGKGQKETREFANNVFLPKLERAARKEGFDETQAHVLSATTTAGSLALLAVHGNSAETLLSKVASLNGTTEAGLKVLQNNPENLPDAVQAAKKRAEELSKKE